LAFDPNLVAVAARQLKRMTTGKSLAQKQDRAANLRQIDNVLTMRPKNFRTLEEAEFRMVGKKKNVPPEVLHVIADKESGRDGGFARDGRLIIADEPQWFSRFTAGAYDTTRQDISYPKWIPTDKPNRLPKGWIDVWGMKHPMKLTHNERWQLWAMQATENFDAAVCAISMGRFQVMGFNWERFGFKSPLDMLEFAYQGEAAHLELCVMWFETEDKMEALRRRDWHTIALYNGTGRQAEYAAECEKLYGKRRGLYA
jgi:hypothetical protein